MPEVGRIVKPVALPFLAPRQYALRPHRTLPPLERLLLRPLVLAVAQTDNSVAHEAAAFLTQGCDHALDYARFQDDVVADEKCIRRRDMVQEKLALLCQAATPQGPFDTD